MAKLLTGTRIYGTANVDSVLVVGNVTSNNSTSNTTGSLVITGGMGITGNLFMSSANNFMSTYNGAQSYRLGWIDNYFMRNNQSTGVDFTGNYLNITSTFYTTSFYYARGLIGNDLGNNTVLFAGSSPVRLQNTAASTSNTTGSLIVDGGIGVTGNINIGGAVANLMFIAGTTSSPGPAGIQLTGGPTSIKMISTGTSGGISRLDVGDGSRPDDYAYANVVSQSASGVSSLRIAGGNRTDFRLTSSGTSGFASFTVEDTGGASPVYANVTSSLNAANVQILGSQNYAFAGATRLRLAGTGSANLTIESYGTHPTANASLKIMGGNTPSYANIGSTTSVGSQVNIISSLPSTSNTTGALVVTGGVGVSGSIYARGNVTVNGDIIVANSSTSNTATIRFNATLNTLDFIIG